METTILHKAQTRGHASHGWLNSHHTFSFAQYHNPDRMNFGVLRVLNDDTVAAGMGFGAHPHDNMEIVSIPLEGDLQHKDSMGNTTVIKKGDIQIMSAGSGVTHSECNANQHQEVKFLQIWIFPNQRNVTPRYDQITLNVQDRHNKLQQIISPDQGEPGIYIHQEAWFHIGKLDSGFSTDYDIRKSGNGLYVFVLSGDIKILGQDLGSRDGFGILNFESVTIKVTTDAEILLMEVPMTIN